MELTGKKINFLGDSITFGATLDSVKDTYHQVLKEECGLLEARSYGINGTRIARQTPFEDTERCFAERYPVMSDDADAVVIFGGTNDHGHGNAQIGSFSDRETSTLYGALHTLYSGLQQKYPKAQIVVMTPLHRILEDEPNGATQKKLSDYVAVIKEVAAFYELPVLDLFTVCTLNPNRESDRKDFFPDGVHPNAAGQRIIATLLKEFLIKL